MVHLMLLENESLEEYRNEVTRVEYSSRIFNRNKLQFYAHKKLLEKRIGEQSIDSMSKKTMG